jgi:hypothetical protein
MNRPLRQKEIHENLDAEAAIRAMDDAADCIESGGASLRAARRNPERTAGGIPLTVKQGPNLEALAVIVDCQQLLSEYLTSDGADANSTITKLLAILNGPRALNLQKGTQ